MNAAVILAGGGSHRMGQTKALMLLRGKPMLRYVVDVTSRLVDEIIVVIGQRDAKTPFAKALPTRVQITRDQLPTRGPAVGLSAGLQLLRSKTFLLLPCDIPLLKPEVLAYLLAEVAGFAAAIPRWSNGRLEPMCAAYQKSSVASALRAALEAEEYSLLDVVKRLQRVKYVPVSKLKRMDPLLHSFLNVNTSADFGRARAAA